ncbi:MAG: phosphoribosylamine--glycine ligase [Bacteroidota bacterium]
MNVLVIGSGGREHAISWKIAQSSLLDNLFIAPGNAGTAQVGTNVDLKETDFEGIKAFVLEKNISLVVVGPEAPLVAGIVNFFEADAQLKKIAVIGPDKVGAQLEGSKDFSKQFMMRHHIPTAAYGTFTAETLDKGISFLSTLKPPYVLKADGLAAGKGVLILNDLEEAEQELTAMLKDAKFGAASTKVVIEEYLNGIELSVFVLTDGTSYKILPEAKDYKRIGDGDEGLNTGGMGAVSPVPFADKDFMERVEGRIIVPTVKGLAAEGITYKGFIFIGLMNVKGDPFVIEYNCRMGDPETEVVIPRIKSDLLGLLDNVASGTLSESDLEIDERIAATVMMVSGGYPGDYEKGIEISGLENVNADETLIFHAGTKSADGKVLTNGGRVLTATSFGKNITEARDRSYRNLELISYEGAYKRSDIGLDLVKVKN